MGYFPDVRWDPYLMPGPSDATTWTDYRAGMHDTDLRLGTTGTIRNVFFENPKQLERLPLIISG